MSNKKTDGDISTAGKLRGEQVWEERPLTRRQAATRNVVLFLVKLCVTGVLLAICLAWIDLGDVAEVFVGIKLMTLALAFAFAVLGTIYLPAVVTKHALGIDRIDLSLRELVAINFSLRFYVIILPRVVSLGLRWLRYGKGRLSHDALALLGFERAVYLTTMFACALVAVSIELPALGNWGAAIWMTTFAGAAVSLVALLPFLYGPAVRLLAAVSGRCENLLPEFLATKLRNLVEAVTAFRSLRKSSNFMIFCLSAGSVVFFVLSAYVVARSLGVEITFLALLWVRALVFALTLIPISIGGVGLREVGFVGLLSFYGVPAPDALAFSFANFGLQLAIAAIGALLEAHRMMRRLSDHRQIDVKKLEENN